MGFLKQALANYRKLSRAAASAEKVVSGKSKPNYSPKPGGGAGKASSAVTGKTYPVGIVGEKNYQAAIRKLREGDQVTLWHEPDNPYDERAIAVATATGATIGYIGKDSWLRDVLLEEAKPCTAGVLRLASGPKGTGVTIEVTLAGQPVRERPFKPG